jgi:hypothetical protein
MPGVLHRRLESFRTMVNSRAVTPERQFQCPLSPNRLLGNQRTHHPHIRHRETSNRFRSHGKHHVIPSSYTIRTQKSCTIRAGNDEGVIFYDSFSLGVSHTALRSHSSFFTCSDDCYVLFSSHFFVYHTLHHKRSSTYLCTILLFSFFF